LREIRNIADVLGEIHEQALSPPGATVKEYKHQESEAIMPLSIRRATPADLLTIVDFNLRLAEESEGKTLNRDVLTAGVQAALADPTKGPYFLAELDGKPVATMQVTTEFSDWRNGWFWWIQGVYVRAEARRQGVFRALYQHVQETAKNDPT